MTTKHEAESDVMAHTSETGLAHRGFVCEELDGSLFEEVYDEETNPAATVRWCRVCGAHRIGLEDAYGRVVAGNELTDQNASER